MDKIIMQRNNRILELYSRYLEDPRRISGKMVEEFADSCGLPSDYAFIALFLAVFGLDTETEEGRILEEQYLRPSIHRLNPEIYTENPYYKNIRIQEKSIGHWKLCQEYYEPYEVFVMDESLQKEDMTEIPQLGFFEKKFTFPAVLENGREWMLITPNEIHTMQPHIERVQGRVAVFGLGLGYFAYMASEKDNVDQVTVIERDRDVLDLFEQEILPQFRFRDKIRLIQADAFSYAEHQMPARHFDFAFTDLWHDASDGVPLYLRMRRLEKYNPGTKFLYWIERTLISCLRMEDPEKDDKTLIETSICP